MIYPRTKTVVADVIGADGGIGIGCEISNGKIVPALSLAEQADNAFSEVAAAGFSAEAEAYIVYSEGKVYYSGDGLNFSALVSLEADFPFLFEERRDGLLHLYIAGNENAVYCNGKFNGSDPFKAGVRGGVMRYGRLFCIDREDGYKLRWSGNNAFDFKGGIDGAGWVYPCPGAGEILNLTSLNDRLIAVCRHGLAVLSAFGTPENFKVEAAFTALPEVAADTAVSVCGKLYFFTEKGLYSFNGSKICEVKHNLKDDFSLVKSAAAFGNLYLAAGYSKTLSRRALLAYNAETEKSYLIDFPADRLVCNDKIYGYSRGCAATFKEGEYTFISGKIDFANGAKKHLNRIEIDGSGGAEISVFDGRHTHVFYGVKDALPVDICGVNFKITVKSDKKINAVRAYAEVLSGV